MLIASPVFVRWLSMLIVKSLTGIQAGTNCGLAGAD